MFRGLDLWMYDKAFGPLAAFLHKRFNWGNFGIARVLFMFGTAVVLLAVAAQLRDMASHMDEYSSLGWLFIAILAYDFYLGVLGLFAINRMENEASAPTNADRLPKNYRDGEYREVSNRRFLLFIVIFSSFSVMTHVPLDLANMHVQSEMFRFFAVFVTYCGYQFLTGVHRPPAKRARQVVTAPAAAQAMWS